jgi:hydrogenase expression/formation protein HypE
MSENKFRFSLECPLPELDFTHITLGHGSGGLLTNQLLDTGVFKLFKSKHLQERHDGVILKTGSETAFTTDSFVVSPIFFPGGSIGELAVNGTVNDIAMCGAIPKYLSLSLILEEGLEISELWEILLSIDHAAKEAGVEIVTGDTKVVDKGKGDKIFINTTGIGEVLPTARIELERIEPGDMIILSHSIAHHGITIMLEREEMDFESNIQSDTRPLSAPIHDLINLLGHDVKLLRDPTRGGVATVLNEICSQVNLGAELDQSQIPVDEDVSSACEILGLDPLYVANEGVFIAIVSRNRASEAVELLRKHSACGKANIIGSVTSDHPRKVVMKSGIGGKRVINMLAGEQLPRIC